MPKKDFGYYIKQGIKILKLNRNAISTISNDKDATKYSIGFVVLVNLMIGSLLAFFIILFTLGFGIIFSWIPIFLLPILGLIFLFVMVGFFYISAKLFGAKGGYIKLFRPFGISYIIYIFTVIPFLGSIASIWHIVAMVVSISETQKMSIGRAIASVAVIILLFGIIAIIITTIFIFILIKNLN